MTHNTRKPTLFVATLLWLTVLVTWLLTLSQSSPPSGLRVYGSPSITVDHTAMLRVIGVDANSSYTVAIDTPTYRVVSETAESKWTAFEDTRKVAWQSSMAPFTSPGLHTIEVRSKIAQDEIRARVKIDVLQNTGTSPSPQFKETQSIRWASDSIAPQIEVAPLANSIYRHFPNPFVLIVPKNTPPPTLTYLDASQRQVPINLVAADLENVFTFKVVAETGELILTIATASQSGTLRFETELSYFQVKAKPVQAAPISASVIARDEDENIFVDLWQGQKWLDTIRLSGGIRSNALEFPIGNTTHSPLWLQAYPTPLNPSQARSGRYVVSDLGLEALLQEWQTTPTRERFRVLERSSIFPDFLLGRLEPLQASPALLGDSTTFQTSAATAQKQQTMSMVSWLLILSTLALMLASVARVMNHRQHLLQRFADLDDESELVETGGGVQSSMVDGIIILLFVAVLMIGIAWLFLTTRW